MDVIPNSILTVRQPWADLIMAGVKDVENRSWPVPSTLPQWMRFHKPGSPASRFRDLPERRPYNEWTTADGPFPFTIGIHAAAEVDREELDGLLDQAYVRPSLAEDIVICWLHHTESRGDGEYDLGHLLGALLGTVTVTGDHHASACQQGVVLACGRTVNVYGDPSPGWKIACACRLSRNGFCEVTGRGPLCSPWAEPDRYHWTLADPQPLDVPVPMKGRPGLWKPADERRAL